MLDTINILLAQEIEMLFDHYCNDIIVLDVNCCHYIVTMNSREFVKNIRLFDYYEKHHFKV